MVICVRGSLSAHLGITRRAGKLHSGKALFLLPSTFLSAPPARKNFLIWIYSFDGIPSFTISPILPHVIIEVKIVVGTLDSLLGRKIFYIFREIVLWVSFFITCFSRWVHWPCKCWKFTGKWCRVERDEILPLKSQRRDLPINWSTNFSFHTFVHKRNHRVEN